MKMTSNDVRRKAERYSEEHLRNHPFENFQEVAEPRLLFYKWEREKGAHIAQEQCIIREQKANPYFSVTYHAIDQKFDDFSIMLDEKLITSLNTRFNLLYHSIEKSRYIYDLEDNWDDEGSVGYKKETWTMAIRFICKYAELSYSKTKEIILTPKIYHGPDGSLDFMWENKELTFLLNINSNGSASYYGDNYKNSKIQGNFELDDFNTSLFPFII